MVLQLGNNAGGPSKAVLMNGVLAVGAAGLLAGCCGGPEGLSLEQKLVQVDVRNVLNEIYEDPDFDDVFTLELDAKGQNRFKIIDKGDDKEFQAKKCLDKPAKCGKRTGIVALLKALENRHPDALAMDSRSAVAISEEEDNKAFDAYKKIVENSSGGDVQRVLTLKVELNNGNENIIGHIVTVDTGELPNGEDTLHLFIQNNSNRLYEYVVKAVPMQTEDGDLEYQLFVQTVHYTSGVKNSDPKTTIHHPKAHQGSTVDTQIAYNAGDVEITCKLENQPETGYQWTDKSCWEAKAAKKKKRKK